MHDGPKRTADEGSYQKGVGERPVLVVILLVARVLVVAVVVVVEVVLDSRRDLLLRFFRLPPTRRRSGSGNTVMIFRRGCGRGARVKARAAIATSPKWLGFGLGPAGGGGSSTWGSRSDRATSPRRLWKQGFCEMQFPAGPID